MSLPRVLAIAGGALGVGYVAISMMGDFKTPGMKNIENRHTAAGGAPSHTPARASPMGREDLTVGRHGDTNCEWFPSQVDVEGYEEVGMKKLLGCDRGSD